MSFREYSSYDGLALAEMVRRRHVTALEVIDAAIARAEAHNGKLNAIVHQAFDEARDAAKRGLTAGPFEGVPFLIKDLGTEVAGMPRSDGTRFNRNLPDTQDSLLVKRYRAAGVNIFGKTNTPEFGITGTTESARLGPCRNPWNTEHITGGSSGGAAAAVAAGSLIAARASFGAASP
ncbi:MAG TPA: 6-aminohexanoate hydrolase, partial [Alphaproteobacteria bacterium]|nr:6-aminohexanoate hydrolase [Alphaproteobacteria bacterium]